MARLVVLLAPVVLGLAGCVTFTSSNPPPPAANTVVVPPGATVVCSDGRPGPCR
jgi:hypothetical protein